MLSSEILRSVLSSETLRSGDNSAVSARGPPGLIGSEEGPSGTGAEETFEAGFKMPSVLGRKTFLRDSVLIEVFGFLILWVTLANPDLEKRAVEVLQRHAADDVHVHELPVVDYRSLQGGVSYDLSFMKRLGL